MKISMGLFNFQRVLEKNNHQCIKAYFPPVRFPLDLLFQSGGQANYSLLTLHALTFSSSHVE